jgi:CheY-like chemotaxis protein/HPt (histidine-containing phosphotransfer) domain-containing protein
LQRILSLALSTEDESSPVPGPLITRHTAREQYPGFQGCKARILLAEDNITNQQVALGILKKLGLTADAVANGREAIEALRMLPYDLVLMDVQMPELDGLEATRQIRNPLSQVNNPRIPVIAMTAHAMQGDKNKCLEAGMNDYVTKPVNPQTLAGVLEKWLPENSRGGRQIPVSGLGKEDKVYEETSTSSTTFAKAEPDYQPVQPVFDRSFVLGLLMGDEQLAEKILQGFLEDIPRQIKVLGEYLTAGDCERAERQAHTIKGASANVGAESLRVLASKAERAGKMGDLDAMKELLKDLTTSFEELKKSI